EGRGGVAAYSTGAEDGNGARVLGSQLAWHRGQLGHGFCLGGSVCQRQGSSTIFLTRPHEVLTLTGVFLSSRLLSNYLYCLKMESPAEAGLDSECDSQS